MGPPRTKPTEINIPKLSAPQIEARFQKRYDIAVAEVFQKVLLPQMRQLQTAISREIQRTGIRFNERNSPEAVQQAVDRVIERTIKQNPNSFISLYLKKYGAVHYVSPDGVRIDFAAGQSALEYESGKLRMGGELFGKNIPDLLDPAKGTSSSYFVDTTAFSGLVAVEIARYLDPHLRKPINEFGYNCSKDEKPPLPLRIEIAPVPKRNDRTALNFSRT
ncbi:hypothetical protein JXA56_01065 [Candidatus Micrarchaeota archaeon]|nr:hypothetical protein [Candidatus Micrarchaeota archaeon]